MPGREIDLSPGSPLVLTHKIKLVPSSSGLSPGPGSGFGSGSCGCEVDLAALLKRVERLEKEASALREKCDGGCCPSVEHKGTADTWLPALVLQPVEQYCNQTLGGLQFCT